MAGQGMVRVRDRGNGRGLQSAARTWTVQTEAGEVTAEIDVLNTFKGPFAPGSDVTVGEDRVRNAGNAEGVITAEFAELDNQGNIVQSNRETATVPAGGCAFYQGGTSSGVFVSAGCGESPTSLGDTMPDQAGAEVNYGFRVWGEDESRPGFPAPASVPGLDTTMTARAERLNLNSELTAVAGVLAGVSPVVWRMVR